MEIATIKRLPNQCETPLFSAHHSPLSLSCAAYRGPVPPLCLPLCLRPRGFTHYSSSIQTDNPCLAPSQSAACLHGSAGNKLLSGRKFSAACVFLMDSSPFQMFQRLLVVAGGSTATVTASAALPPSSSFVSLDQFFALASLHLSFWKRFSEDTFREMKHVVHKVVFTRDSFQRGIICLKDLAA